MLDDKDCFETASENWATSWLGAARSLNFWPPFKLGPWLVKYAPYLDKALEMRGALPYSCAKPFFWLSCRTHAVEPSREGIVIKRGV